MKKGIIKWAVFMVVFVASLFIFSRLLNTGTNDMTMDVSSQNNSHSVPSSPLAEVPTMTIF
jgi:hypothetical protein